MANTAKHDNASQHSLHQLKLTPIGSNIIFKRHYPGFPLATIWSRVKPPRLFKLLAIHTTTVS